ncbi:MAG: homoserine kinase, partial [Firmicutes bacterium]|nr:homoserine kinase [Bacillota bacterium]
AVGGFTICLPGGPGVRYLAVRRRMPLTAVMAVPAFQLSTSKARRALPESVPFQDAVFNVGRSSFLVASLLSGRTALLGVAMEDRLHQPHRAPLVPGLEAALRAAREAGALGAALSGAGPSVIALAPEGETETIRRIAGALADAFKEAGVEAKSYPVELARKGAELIV